jgi:preprotein translocase subunit SecG
MADSAESTTAHHAKKSGSFLSKYKWWIAAGVVGLVIFIWVMMQNSQNSAGTNANTQPTETGTSAVDPTTGVPYADEIGYGGLSGSPGPAGPAGAAASPRRKARRQKRRTTP